MPEQLTKLVELRRGDIIHGVVPRMTEIDRRGEKVFVYRLSIPYVKGILCPNDDYIELRKPYRVIINRILLQNMGGILFSEVYHDDKELLNENIGIKVRGMGHEGEPYFRLRGHHSYYIGFVKNSNAKPGDVLIVKARKIKPGKIEDKIIEAEEIARIK